MAWDATKPASAEAKSLAPAQIQGNWAALEDWLNDLSNFPTTPAAFSAGKLGWTLIQTQSAAASATIDFTSGITSTYDQYVVTLTDMLAASAASPSLYMRISQSAVFDIGLNYAYAYSTFTTTPSTASIGATASSVMAIADTLSNTSFQTLSGQLFLNNPTRTTGLHTINYQFSWKNSSGVLTGNIGTAEFTANTNAIDGIRFFLSVGNITSGTFALYGVRKT